MRRQKVDVADLKVGMYVSRLDRPWLDSPFLFQGFPIRNQADIDALRRCCDHVFIDLDEGRDWQPPQHTPQPEATEAQHRFSTERLNLRFEEREAPEPPSSGQFMRDLERAYTLHHETHAYIRQVFDRIQAGQSFDTADARALVDEMVVSIVEDDNALLWLTQLKQRDEYTSLHSLNVCILSMLFAHHLGMTQEQLREVGTGGLLHDIGKMKVPLEILNKPGRLNDKEMALLRTHPRQGYEMLRRHREMSPAALDVVYSHHERIDGSGYPRGLRGGAISRYAMVVSLVDVYDAVTSDRAYHAGISPHEALNLMYEREPHTFHPELLEAFIRCLGIYPVGSIVELDTGEVGVVMTVNRRQSLKPMVNLVLDSRKRAYPVRKMLNLAAFKAAESAPHIRRILGSGAYGIDVRRIILEARAMPASA